MSKEIIIKFIGSLGNRAGVIDGTVEAGRNASDCHKDKWDIGLSSATAIGNLSSHLGLGFLGNFGGGVSVVATITSVAKTGKITLNDIATIGAGLAGVAVEFLKKKPGLVAARLASSLTPLAGARLPTRVSI